jgi:NADPH:quinone reductase-like Zn-dependent oxidoreductase
MTDMTLQVRKDRLTDARLVELAAPSLQEGQVRVRVDTLALTANNVTYGAFGESMHYWDFYPVHEEGWGIVPAWGFGTVVQSLHPGVAVGERLYGYWPMANTAILQPQRLSERGFAEGAPHRARLHGVYNQYLRCNRDPLHTPAGEDLQALLRPLFNTAWLIDDFLADQDFFGARAVLLSSASSKTAWATALMLRQRAGIETIAFTSAANAGFCESLGCYSRVLSYEEAGRVEADLPCVYVDFSGDARFRKQVHESFRDLRYSCAVGGTHVSELGGAEGLPGPRPTPFFAPAQAEKRQADWGARELGMKVLAGWQLLSARLQEAQPPWLRIQRHEGAPAALRAWQRLAAGDVDPSVGLIVSVR